MPIKTLREFIQFETSSGMILFIMALLAILFNNTGLHEFYSAFLNFPIGFHIGFFRASQPSLLFINDGLMAIFFLLVGLEIKREMLEGELNSAAKAVLPAVAAIGGMIVPAFVYILINWGSSVALRGWAIPTATDIAFSLGIIALLGSRVPVTLKIFLTALAIFDDIGAIIVIAIFYSQGISWVWLGLALALCFLLFLLNQRNVVKITPFMIIGLVLWFCVLKSGVHATLAGIMVAMAIPLRHHEKPHISPLRVLEHRLHPWVAFGVLPLFAFSNAGIDFSQFHLKGLFSPVTLGIAAGLFLGKQIGVSLTSWMVIRMGFARMPRGVTYASIYGIALIAGVGFTMSLFIGNLAFNQFAQIYTEMVRIGVIFGSVVSGVFGYLVLYFTYARRAHSQ